MSEPVSSFLARRQLLSALSSSTLAFGASACKARSSGEGGKPRSPRSEAELRGAVERGGAISLCGERITLSAPLKVPSQTALIGPGSLILSADFRGMWAIAVAPGTNQTISKIEIDGSGVRGDVISGVRTEGDTTGLTITDCHIHDLPFVGIDVSGGAGLQNHRGAAITGNRVENVGWVAINLEAVQSGRITSNVISRTGYHGIATMLGCSEVLVRGNRVSKALPPDKIFSGAGSLGGKEGGFLIAFDQTTSSIVIDSNICDDNRAAGYDGIGVGEDGTEFGRSIIRRNLVRRAGLFGIDAPGNCLVEDNVIEGSATQGIHVGLDLGGVIQNVVVRRNTIRDTGDTPGENYGILIGDSLGPRLVMRNIEICDNVVVDDRAPPGTDYGIGIVYDEAEYSNLTIRGNDLRGVGKTSILNIGRDNKRAVYRSEANLCRGGQSFCIRAT